MHPYLSFALLGQTKYDFTTMGGALMCGLYVPADALCAALLDFVV